MSSVSNNRVEKLVQSIAVLIVDDNQYMRKVIRNILVNIGVKNIHEAADGIAGLEAIRMFAPDLVILDLGLPDGDGCSILEKLQVSHPSLPVIVLTASNRDLGPLRAYARLTKPWDRGELCGILHRATGKASP